MNELSLFTGAGGGLLGTHLLGWRPIGYVEFNTYCQRVIAQRIADGILPVAPIFGDVRQFVESGAAREYRGFADVVTGGFPCQPFSVAGKRAGADDARNMWPATIATIRAVRPRYAFLENVPGLVSSGYFGTILGDLAESGYDARWRILSAAEMGAPHKRDRLWIVAHATSQQDRRVQQPDLSPHARASGQHVAHTNGTDGKAWRANTVGNREQGEYGEHSRSSASSSTSTKLSNASPVHAQGQHYRQGQGQLGRSGWWEVEPNVGRVADRMAFDVDRLKAIGNGQVPAVAAAAWHLLTEPTP